MFALTTMTVGKRNDILQIAFNIYNIDKNGRLTIDEIKKVLRAIYDFLSTRKFEKLEDKTALCYANEVMETLGEIILHLGFDIQCRYVI